MGGVPCGQNYKTRMHSTVDGVTGLIYCAYLLLFNVSDCGRLLFHLYFQLLIHVDSNARLGRGG